MGVDIPGKKHIRFALRYIHGIGPKRADDVLAAVKVDPMKKADDVTQDEIHAITTYIQDHFRVEGDLRREVSQNIRRLIQIGFYLFMIRRPPRSTRCPCTTPFRSRRKGGKRVSIAMPKQAGR